MKKHRPLTETSVSGGTRRALAFARDEKDSGDVMPDQRNKQLILSFWDICMANLPKGTFSHRSITGQEAKSLITQARQDKQLLCVSGDDLLAPYRKDEAKRHKQLCVALGKQFGIVLSLRDFITASEYDGEPLYSITPLQCVQLEAENQLLVVACGYTLSKAKGESLLNPGVAPESITFHLIEAL